MIDLSTNYLGLKLKNPVVVSASPLTEKLENFPRLEDAGRVGHRHVLAHGRADRGREREHRQRAGVRHQQLRRSRPRTCPTCRSTTSAPTAISNCCTKARPSVSIPVIGQPQRPLARRLGALLRVHGAGRRRRAGAEHLRHSHRLRRSRPNELETRYCNLVRTIRKSVRIPIAVKLGPVLHLVRQLRQASLSEAGADGVVIFNRFYQPDFDLEELEVTPNLVLSSPHELRLRLHWAAILYHQVETYIAITGGVHDCHRRAEVHDGGRARRHDDLGAAEVRHRAHRRGAGRHGSAGWKSMSTSRSGRCAAA